MQTIEEYRVHAEYTTFSSLRHHYSSSAIMNGGGTSTTNHSCEEEAAHNWIVQCMEAGDRAKAALDYNEASKMYEKAINFQASLKTLPLPHRGMMEPSIKLGLCLCEQARYQEAENILTRCLNDAGSGRGSGDFNNFNNNSNNSDPNDNDNNKNNNNASSPYFDTALHVRALTALANLYQAQSKYAAALALHERAVPIARRMCSTDIAPLLLADNLAGYGETLRKTGDLPRAERCHAEALSIRTRAAKDGACDELELAVSYTQLGCTLADLGRHSEAYRRHHAALALRYRYLDFVHGLVSESLNYCAECLCHLGRGGEGVPLAMHAASIRREIFGTSHPAYAHALSVLASCYFSVGRYGDARDSMEMCLEICQAAFSENHANKIVNYMNYGDVLRSMGDLVGARDAYRRAGAIHLTNFGEGQRSRQLERCLNEAAELTEEIEGDHDDGAVMMIESHSSSSKVSSSTAGTYGSSAVDATCERMDADAAGVESEGPAPIISCSTDMSGTSLHDQPHEIDSKGETNGSLPDRLHVDSTYERMTAADIELKGAPVVVFTDIGRDVDDEMALVLISALKRKRLMNPIAVVTTLSPQDDRAALARGSLDSLCMADVPVGVGGRGGVAEGVDLEVYEADHARPSPSIHRSGMELARRALESVPPKSAQVLCLASMSDLAELIRDHGALFASRVKEVVIMGGVLPLDSGDALRPDSAYNNNCDMASAAYVYERCQTLGTRTVTLSRWAAYGCPIRPHLIDELAKTKHMVAANVRTMSKVSIEQLWNKVVRPLDDPRREKLPARCDVTWFYRTFCGSDARVPERLPASIWNEVEKLNMYDPLAALVCVPSYRAMHFRCAAKVVNGVSHLVVGTSEDDTGVVDHMSLYKEYSHLFIESLQGAMHEPEMPVGSVKVPDMLIEETSKIFNGRNRAA